MREYCYKCGRRLDDDRIVWLELDTETGEFQPEGSEPLPEERSQGYFPFGPDCARKVDRPMYVEESDRRYMF